MMYFGPRLRSINMIGLIVCRLHGELHGAPQTSRIRTLDANIVKRRAFITSTTDGLGENVVVGMRFGSAPARSSDCDGHQHTGQRGLSASALGLRLQSCIRLADDVCGTELCCSLAALAASATSR